MGGISRAGNERLRQLLVSGATAVIRYAKPGSRASAWLLALAGAPAAQARGGGSGQQDGPHRVGHDDDRRGVSGAVPLSRRPSDRLVDARVQDEQQEMTIGRSDDPENPGRGNGLSRPLIVWGWIAEPIWASGHVAASTGRTHDRNRTAVNSPVTPCIQGPFSNRSSLSMG